MKTKIGILVLALCTVFFNVEAQRRVITTTRATSYDISDNLDLDAVASVFGDSENLEDFERRLNDPDSRISNLDLNEDGYIDYLRVFENSSDRNSLVIIQAVLDNDVYQDVATIEIEKVSNGNMRIQLVGDAYIYGSNYIIEPVFVRTPLIFSFFWGPRYSTWNSPYYWNYYPNYFHYYRPYSPFRYQRNVYGHINRYNTYHRANNRTTHFSGDNYNHIRRSDYAEKHPDRAFTNRNHGVSNRNELIERRPGNRVNKQKSIGTNRSNDRQYQDNRKSNSGRSERQRDVNEYKRPASNNQPTSNPTRTRENSKVNSNQKKSYSNSRSEIKKANTGREQNQRRSVSPGKSSSAPARSVNRVEPTKKSPVSSGKSERVSNQNRSKSQVKSNQKSERKSNSGNQEKGKESKRNRRR